MDEGRPVGRKRGARVRDVGARVAATTRGAGARGASPSWAATGRAATRGAAARGAAPKDLALVFGPSPDGRGVHVLRRRSGSDTVEAGVLRPLEEGRAITGEVVHLAPRPEAPFLFDCETDEELSTPRARDAGPPRVATDEYRRGWDAIWGARARSTAVN
jgi:hypothetical protein